MAAVLELSTPWCGRDIHVKVPGGFLPGASPEMGRLWLPGGPEHSVGAFAEVLRCLLLVFNVVFVLQFWEVIHTDEEVCIESSQ